ncbi:MAG TPA: DNA ligase [Pirellulales bacterium]|nr:DNA ligase [Pirellulales bacterium]
MIFALAAMRCNFAISSSGGWALARLPLVSISDHPGGFMPDLQDGESTEVQGSARLPYILKNVGGVYSCTCPAWRNQSLPIERRTCKHLIRYRGEQAEAERLARTVSPPAIDTSKATAPPILLAESWDNATDVISWWLSEKLDGVRAYWDGKRFLSRQGNVFHAPDWFTAGLPTIPLDGELWLARKAFQRTVSIVRRHDGNSLWAHIKFRIFDAPALREPFEERIEYLCDCFSQLRLRYVGVLPQQQCRSLEHLRDELELVLAGGGEGLMLRQPGSQYESGRSSTLLKVKRFHDAEAQVIEHQPGAGRHKGRMGALLVQLPDGTTFSVGTGFTDAQREDPPPVGTQITFRYQELTDRGVPRFPSFVRVRADAP